MTVISVDDINVKVLDDPEHGQLHKGFYVLQPNSVRKDVKMDYTLPHQARVREKPWLGRELK